MSEFLVTEHIERKHRKQELLKLMAARSDFSGARSSCNCLLEQAPLLSHDLNYPLTVAAIVCYARPFTANEPYGALPKRYTRSLNAEQKQFHKEVVEARHQYFAHTDLTDRNAYIHPAGTVIAKYPAKLKSPKIGSSFSSRLYHPSYFQKILCLAGTMHEAINSDIEDLLDKLYNGMELPPMKFKLRVDNGL